MSYKILFVLFTCVLLAVSYRFAKDPVSAPGILVISADDLGNHLGSYGDSTVPTPHIDALAAAGTRFSRAYVTQPSCSSSRASFLTGLYPHQNGQLGLAHSGFAMTGSWPLLPELLKTQLDYFTAVGGKLHVGPSALFDFLDESEFETSVLWTQDIKRVGSLADRYFKLVGERPFYIQFDLRDPHRPFQAQHAGLPAEPVGPEDIETFSWMGSKSSALAADTANYYNGVSRLDSLVGRIIDALRKSGRLENTVIVFWSDNGPPFSRAKTTLFEPGVRVPLIIAGPGIAAGQVREELVSMVDLMPTLLLMSGAQLPAGKANYPGRDLTPLLKAADIPWRRYLFTETNFHSQRQWAPARAVTDGNWKLIERLGENESRDRWELYNLDMDRNERRNLANRASHKQRRDQLRQELLQWRVKTADPLLDASALQQLEQVSVHPERPLAPWYQPPQGDQN